MLLKVRLLMVAVFIQRLVKSSLLILSLRIILPMQRTVLSMIMLMLEGVVSIAILIAAMRIQIIPAMIRWSCW